MPSFSFTNPNLPVDGPIVTAAIGLDTAGLQARKSAGHPAPAPIQMTALVDTGAGWTVIRAGTAAQLGLNQIGAVSINTPNSAGVVCPQYSVRIVLPNNVSFEGAVIEAPLHGQKIQCLIGRDILMHGALIYTGFSNTWALCF